MKRKISYVTLASDLYLLLGVSLIIYGLFFGFERIGQASFSKIHIKSSIILIISMLEIIYCIIISYLLHKCDNKIIRIITIVLCLLNIGYRILNLLEVTSIFTSVILFFVIILLLNLIFY